METVKQLIRYQGKALLALVMLLILFVLVYETVGAQSSSGGQFCVRAFEDRNGNGLFDGGEPLLTRGLSLNLLDARNVTVASALLDQSPTAAQGVVCFQRLTPGQYTITVTSADFAATTPDAFTTTITDTSVEVVQYGARSVAASATSQAPATGATGATLDRTELARIVLSALGALIVIAGMVLLGVIIYYVVLRNRRSSVNVVEPRRATTGSMPPVSTVDTGEVPKA